MYMTFSRRLSAAVEGIHINVSLDLWHAPQDIDAYVSAHPELLPLQRQPVAMWIGDWVTTPGQRIADCAQAAAGKIMLIPIYAIPNRDSGGYSAGGFQNQSQYLAWVTDLKNGAGSSRVWYILEPDALGLASSLSSSAKAERLDTLSKAVTILKTGANAKLYIDCSHWLAPATAADLLISANVAACEGFSLNVSNFQTTPAMYAFGDQVIAQLANRSVMGKKYVIDTSRNGNGPLTSAFGSAADPWLNANKAWCNPPGRGLGLSPRIPVGQPNCAALLYIKTVGESDGNDPGSTFFSSYFSDSAPAAGTFWLNWALDLVQHTDLNNLQ